MNSRSRVGEEHVRRISLDDDALTCDIERDDPVLIYDRALLYARESGQEQIAGAAKQPSRGRLRRGLFERRRAEYSDEAFCVSLPTHEQGPVDSERRRVAEDRLLHGLVARGVDLGRPANEVVVKRIPMVEMLREVPLQQQCARRSLRIEGKERMDASA